MINGKPVTVQPGYKWGRAQALGIGNDDETFLVTTGLGDELNAKVAERTALALNCHDDLLSAAKSALQSNMLGTGEESVTISRSAYEALRAAIAKAEGRT